MGKSDTTSPLTDRPLHNPGQSLDRQLADLLDEKVLLPLMVALLLAVLAALEWFRWYRDAPPQPVPYTLAAIGFGIYAVFTIRRSWKHLRAIRLGRDGERDSASV